VQACLSGTQAGAGRHAVSSLDNRPFIMNKRRFLGIAAVGIALSGHAASTVAAEAAGQSGPRAIALPTPQAVKTPGKVEVIEFFWYGCPSCYQVETAVEEWQRKLPPDVVFRREHALWAGRGVAMETHARIFLTLRAMGLLEANHRVMFDAIHRARMNFRDDEVVLDWAERRGIDRQKFQATYNSPALAAELERSRQMTRNYAVDNVPAFVVNGKYKTSPYRVGTASQMFALIEELIASERQGKGERR
jgi:protein dithiol oxidoreductase (disulfide-forming)